MNTEAASQSPEDLLQAFSATDYRVRVAGGDHVVRPGRRHPALDDAVAGRPWAVITAFNPNARQLDDADNAARHRRLLAAVDRLGLEAYPAVNRDPRGDWPDETALLIVDAGLDVLDALAAEFGQAAIVTAGTGRAARLRLYGSRWPLTLPEWAGRAG